MQKANNNLQNNRKFLENHKNWSNKEIATRLGVCEETIRIWFRKLNINKPPNKRNRKYQFDENFFEKIDTEKKAYFLGLILTDGTLTKNPRYDLYLGFCEKDKDILEKFADTIKVYPRKIYQTKKESHFGYRIRIGSKRFHSSLSKYISPNKTFTVQMPKIKKNLLRHFARGCWDGDGSIERNKCDFISASEKFFSKFYKLLNKIAGRKLQVWTTKQGYNVVRLTRVDKNVLDWMYKNASIFMDRKANKYNEFWKLLPNIKARR